MVHQVCRLLKFILLSLLILSFAGPSFAKSRKSKRRSSQEGLIQVDGAAVYQKPDFDSRVVHYLKKGQRVRISTRTYSGTGGFGAFYKVRYAPRKYGYITDIEVVPQFETAGPNGKKLKENETYGMADDDERGIKPIYFQKWIGGFAGLVGFSEKIGGKTASEDVMAFGVRLTGPETLYGGLPLDSEILVSPSVPDYYGAIVDEGSGFLLMASTALQFPYYQGRRSLVYYGIGPLLVYTNFQLTVGDEDLDSQELRLGAVINAGYAHRIGRFALRLDARYYWEEETYLGYGLSLQHEY